MSDARRLGLIPRFRHLRRALCTLLVLGAGPAVPATQPTHDRGTTMSQAIDAVHDAVQQFDKAQDLALLQTAGAKLESVDLSQAPGGRQRVALRAAVMAAWAAILSRVDAARPAVEPDDPPVTRVFARTPPGMPTYPPNIDPKQIADPQVRAEYEKDLEANRRKAQLTQRHWDVKALDTEVSQGARRFVRRFYTTAPADQLELHDILEKAKLGAARRKQLSGA